MPNAVKTFLIVFLLTASARADLVPPRLAIDDQLTTLTIQPLAILGRGVPVLDFAIQARIMDEFSLNLEDIDNPEETSVSIRQPSNKTALTFKLGDGTCEQIGGKLYAPIGYLCRQLGYSIELDPQNRYLRVLTPRNETTREEFLEKHESFLDALLLREAIENREVRLAVFAINDLLLGKNPAFLIAGNTYLPLQESVDELRGRITSERSSESALPVPSALPRSVIGDLGSFVIQSAPPSASAPSLHGFTLNTAQPLIIRQGKTFIEARFLQKFFKVQIIELSPESSWRDFHAIRLTNRPGVKPTRDIFSEGLSWERASATLRKSEKQLFKTAYLTFDDGPSRNITPQILDILKAHGVRATFFVLGKEVAARPELLKRIHEEGHIIANHTYSHRREIIYRSVDGLMDEIRRSDDLFEEIIAERSRMFRAPYGVWGNLKTAHYKALHDAGYKIYNWNVDAGDSTTRNIKAAAIVEEFRKQIETKTEALILFHDAASKQETVKALPEVIKILREKNFEILPLEYETEIRIKDLVK